MRDDVNMRQNDRDPFADGVVTVRSALELPAIKRGVPEIIAGHDALDRRRVTLRRAAAKPALTDVSARFPAVVTPDRWA
jgi:hypothetical protein